jgi:REP element-mobilizing transposase RayT
MEIDPQNFQSKYKIKSTRLENYDYTQNGLYFVTICTKDREELFGEVIDGKMVLNSVGKITNQFWQEIPRHFPFVNLDEFVLMPNHVHGILEINKNILNECTRRDEALPRLENNKYRNANQQPQGENLQHKDVLKNQDVYNNKHQDEALPRLYKGGYPQMSKISPKPGSLSVIMGAYKSIVSKTVRNKLNPITFAWQPKFYDHIIRNDESLSEIREYVIKNPEMWERDRNNVENVFM